ncbi:MAG: DoxX family protein [Caulobacterales bacterium]|nr:DoxX family protein [Caulobacterales bacterium]
MTAISHAATAAPTTGRAMAIGGWTLTGLFTAFMIFDSGIKLARLPMVEETGRQIGLPAGSGFSIGVAELAIVALYLFPRTAVLGAILVAALMGGTAAVHWAHGDPWASHILFGPYLAVFAWGGLWLRDARLRALLPIRR